MLLMITHKVVASYTHELLVWFCKSLLNLYLLHLVPHHCRDNIPLVLLKILCWNSLLILWNTELWFCICCMSLTTHTDSGKLDIELNCESTFDSATTSYNFTATFTVPKLISVAIRNFVTVFGRIKSESAPILGRGTRTRIVNKIKVCQHA